MVLKIKKLNPPTTLETIMFNKRVGIGELYELIKDACNSERLLKQLKKDYLAPVCKAKLSRLKTGKESFNNLNAETIIKIAYALDVKVEELLIVHYQ